ncbi:MULTISPECIES: SDR family oxidoreductase [Marinobacter]|uniref:UDP-glucose 4-epimerase family protein n=1 Tax=Marinobacter TaxID=2742 RepID=UPI002942BF99|nr:SDR family oxidoreductase [Marinobacter salarius]WOI21284.1 SDR family oxidoreductase [Marinobacter salarius]
MSNHTNVLVTGASGFVGRYLSKTLLIREDVSLTGAVRVVGPYDFPSSVPVGEINEETDWSLALPNKQVVVHTAARVHIMNDEVADPINAFRQINVAGTLNLARQSAEAGVRRFLFLSSIKVNGEETPLGTPFTASDSPMPKDDYGTSKMEAELGLLKISRETGMEIVIIRPPLVYGPGVKGNFATMVELVKRGVPLPFGSIRNKRSLVGLDNLVDLVITCIDHPAAANQVFLAGDGVDLSTTDLFRGIAGALGKSPRLIPVPPGLLKFGATMLGKRAVAQRLLGSLQVDISKARDLLGWRPPVSVEEGLASAVRGKVV